MMLQKLKRPPVAFFIPHWVVSVVAVRHSAPFRFPTGLLPVSRGDCLVYGTSIKSDMRQIRKSLGLCPQHDILCMGDSGTCLCILTRQGGGTSAGYNFRGKIQTVFFRPFFFFFLDQLNFILQLLSKYPQKSPALCTGLYAFPLPAGRDNTFFLG
jgi:hypothetical protein